MYTKRVYLEYKNINAGSLLEFYLLCLTLEPLKMLWIQVLFFFFSFHLEVWNLCYKTWFWVALLSPNCSCRDWYKINNTKPKNWNSFIFWIWWRWGLQTKMLNIICVFYSLNWWQPKTAVKGESRKSTWTYIAIPLQISAKQKGILTVWLWSTWTMVSSSLRLHD